MSKAVPAIRQLPRGPRKRAGVFNLSPIAAAFAGISMLASGVGYAEDGRSAADIQAEVIRLKQLLAQEEQALAAKGGGQPGAADAPAAEGQVAVAPATAAAEPAAQAGDAFTLDQVVVRGSNRRARLKDVPQSVSVVTGEELDRELAVDLGAITRRSAGIQFNQNNTRGASLSVRGLGKRSFTETQDPSVGLTVDGVSYGLTQLGNFDFFDVESVDVVRGPQGTKGGKGGSSGAVTINTRKPSFTPSADYALTYGERDAILAKANFGGAVIDDLLAWRGSFIADRSRGYYESAYDPNYSFYNRNRLAGRVQFLLTPTPELNVRVSADLEPKAAQLENGLTFRHDQPGFYENGDPTDPNGTTARAKLVGFGSTPARSLFVGRTYSSNGNKSRVYTYDDYISKKLLQDQNQGQTVTNKGASVEANYTLPDHVLTSVSAWRQYSFDAHNDEGTPFDINRNGGGGVDYQQYTQEFRLDSNPGELVDYSTGLFFIKTADTISSKTGWGSDAGAWLATDNQYKLLERDAGVNRGAGIALLKDSLDDAYTVAETKVDTSSTAIFGQLNWHLAPKVNLLTGLRITREDRSTDDDKVLSADGVGAALNPVSVRGVALGGFNSDAAGNVLVTNNSAEQLALANSVAQRYYGVADYASLTPAQKKQVATAKAVRANAIGALSDGVSSDYNDVLFTGVFSPSYKINDDLTAYASWQYGEKSGSALNVNFSNANVRPEKTNAYELGLKSTLLDKTLTLSADVYYMDIRDYQSAVRVVDEFTTQTNLDNGVQPNLATAYVTAQGNIKRVGVKGLELDAFYSGIPHTTLRFAGAYTDARYKDYKNAAKPEELGYLPDPYIDQSGKVLPGVSKWTFNVGAEYRYPVFNDKTFHTSFNTNYNSRYNNTDLLSDYGWVDASSKTDASIGLTNQKGFDVSLIVKNLFDDRSHEEGWTSYSPNPYPRWIGITLSGKL